VAPTSATATRNYANGQDNVKGLLITKSLSCTYHASKTVLNPVKFVWNAVWDFVRYVWKATGKDQQGIILPTVVIIWILTFLRVLRRRILKNIKNYWGKNIMRSQKFRWICILGKLNQEHQD